MNFYCVAILRFEGLSIMTANYTLNHAFSDIKLWMNLGNLILREKSRFQKTKYSNLLFYRLKTRKSNNILLKNHIFRDIK